MVVVVVVCTVCGAAVNRLALLIVTREMTTIERKEQD